MNKLAIRTVRTLWKNVLRRRVVLGFIESIDETKIHGWVIHRWKRPLQLHLLADGRTFSLEAQWVERRDVAEKHGPQFIHAGFQCPVTGAAADALRRGLEHSQPVGVLANDVVLTNVGEQRKSRFVLRPTRLAIRTQSSVLDAQIESWGHFTIRGWATASGNVVRSFQLLCNGAPIECAIVCQERSDVAEALGIEALATDFEIDPILKTVYFVTRRSDATSAYPYPATHAVFPSTISATAQKTM